MISTICAERERSLLVSFVRYDSHVLASFVILSPRLVLL